MAARRPPAGRHGCELRRSVNVCVNGEDVRFLDGLGTALKSGDEVSIVPAVAGG